MAEYCKARLLAARAGVTMALLALIGAVPAWAKSRPPVAKNSITSSQIKNGTLELKDFKRGQIYSAHKVNRLFKAENKAINALSVKWGALETSWKTVSTQLSDIDTQLTSTLAGIAFKLSDVYQKADADARFLHKADTAANSQKLDGIPAADFVQGDGSVFTGHGAFTGGVLIAISHLVTVDAVSAAGSNGSGAPVPSFTLTNTSSEVLSYATSEGLRGTIQPGKLLAVAAGAGSDTIQLLPASGGRAVTLTLSSLPAVQAGAAPTALAQALVGAS